MKLIFYLFFKIFELLHFFFKVVPGLLMVMENNYDHPRVQAHAGAALINFSESCPKNLLTGYLEAIMNTLEQILNAKFKEVCHSFNISIISVF